MPITLYPYQETVLQQALQLPHPALFLEMRLGKTIVAIRLLRARKARRVLIVAPLTVCAVWAEHCAGEDIQTIDLRRQKKTQPWGWHVVNYEYLLRHRQVADEWWDAVVLDESTRIRNPRAKTSQVCMRGFRGVGTRVILTGCPAPENPLEYGPQFLFLTRNICGYRNYWDWRRKAFQPSGYGGYTWLPRPGTANEIRNYVRDNAVSLRRQDVNVGGLKVHSQRWVEPTAHQNELMDEVVNNWSVDGSYTQWAVVTATWLARLAGGHHPETDECVSNAKATELVDLLTGELHGQKVVVFFRFNDELALVDRTLSKHGIPCECIQGATPVATREVIRQRFAADPRLRVVLLQLKCAKLGLDFSAADTAIYYSNGFSLEDRLQSEDRIIHPAKRSPLLYLDLITRDSVDEDVAAALKHKNLKSQVFMSAVFEAFKARMEASRGHNRRG